MDYYGDHDAYAAEWLERLIAAGELPAGVVDRRGIEEVQADELRGYRHVHLFCGIGGWPLALRLAGWPDSWPVWSGSCPCQPFSSAGRGEGTADKRHLWPEMFRLVRECRPAMLLGEQVDSRLAHGWLDGVFADLEAVGYACGAVALPAAGVGAPHARHRLFWLADARGAGVRSRGPGADAGAAGGAAGAGPQRQRVRADAGHDGSRGVALGNTAGRGQRADGGAPGDGRHADQSDAAGGLADARGGGLRDGGRAEAGGAPGAGQGGDGQRQRVWPDAASGVHGLPADGVAQGDTSAGGLAGYDMQQAAGNGEDPGHGLRSPWSDFALVYCRDDKSRRISAQPGDEPLAHGIPSRRADPRMGYLLARLGELGHRPDAARRLLKDARRNRVGRLRGYGNAIVPQVAAVFVRVVMDILAKGWQP